MRPAGISQFLTFFFRAQGRIARVEFLLGAGFIYVVNFAVVFYALGHLTDDAAGLAFLSLVGVPSLIAYLVLIAKRCHDLGLPGGFLILALLPFVSVLWVIALAAIPGNAGPNRFGAAPAFDPD